MGRWRGGMEGGTMGDLTESDSIKGLLLGKKLRVRFIERYGKEPEKRRIEAGLYYEGAIAAVTESELETRIACSVSHCAWHAFYDLIPKAWERGPRSDGGTACVCRTVLETQKKL